MSPRVRDMLAAEPDGRQLSIATSLDDTGSNAVFFNRSHDIVSHIFLFEEFGNESAAYSRDQPAHLSSSTTCSAMFILERVVEDQCCQIMACMQQFRGPVVKVE